MVFSEFFGNMFIHGKDDWTTNSLHTRHSMKKGYKFVSLMENYEIIKVINNKGSKIKRAIANFESDD